MTNLSETIKRERVHKLLTMTDEEPAFSDVEVALAQSLHDTLYQLAAYTDNQVIAGKYREHELSNLIQATKHVLGE